MKLCRVLIICLIVWFGEFGTCRVVNAVLPNPKDATLEQEFNPPSLDKQVVNFLQFSVNYLYRPGGQGDWKLLEDGSSLRSGDHYKIIFVSDKDAYVHVFQIDSTNKIYQLFPMERYGNQVLNNVNPVRAGEVYYIPAEGKSFVLDDQTGTETLYFLASRTQDATLELQYQKVVEYQNAVDNDLRKQLAELDALLEYANRLQGEPNLAEQSETGKRVVWKEAGETFSVLQRRLENMCDGCVHVVTFEHR